MRIEKFLKEVDISFNSWDDYGLKQTAVITMPGGEKSFYVNFYPNEADGSIYSQIKASKKIDPIYFYCADQEYYETLNQILESQTDREEWYNLTGDIAYNYEKFIEYYDNLKMKEANYVNDVDGSEELSVLQKTEVQVFDNSFFRSKLKKEWKSSLQQLHRLTVGQDYLSDYSFDIYSNETKLFSVNVKPKDNIVVDSQDKDNLLPFSVSNNVFAIIGDNGSGKTTFIRNLAKAFLGKSNSKINIKEKNNCDTNENVNKIDKILYVSFSPFDTKIELTEETKEAKENKENKEMKETEEDKRLYYIGIHNALENEKLSDRMQEEIMKSLKELRNREELRYIWFQLMNRINSERWITRICMIMEDEFHVVKVDSEEDRGDIWEYKCENDVRKDIAELSSGQKIFILSLTKIVLEMTERTVVFFDEPELFLHPPLIKAYIRLIADLTSKYNGLTFIVTHSPITIQEIPHQCVKVAARNAYGDYTVRNIDVKTFGESISTINESIFKVGLEQTGFYNLIELMKYLGTSHENYSKLDKIVGSEGKVLIKYLKEI